jgi:hypothetical protein
MRNDVKIIPIAASKRKISFFGWVRLNFAVFMALPKPVRQLVTAITLILTTFVGMGCVMLLDAAQFTFHNLQDAYSKDVRDGKVAYSVVTAPAEPNVTPDELPVDVPTVEPEAPVEDDRPSPAPSMPKAGSPQPEKYIQKYLPLAKELWIRYKIPVAITLAQGIIESRSGTSTLAVQNNNHFGMKCFAKNCRKGHCTNHTDDTHKDFFKKFKTVRECFLERGKLLSSGRYAKLKKHGRDYRKWAYGLKSVGYATDPNYAQTLIRTIERYGLNKY